MEQTEVAMEIEKWISLISVLIPILFFIYPVICGIIATIAAQESHDRLRNWLAELARNIGISYFAAAVYFYYTDKSVAEITDGGKLFYGYTAFVLTVPMFYKQVISSAVFRKLINAFINKKFGIKDDSGDRKDD